MDISFIKFRHIYLNKYILSRFKRKKYALSYEYNNKILWFRNCKVGTRTIDKFLSENSNKYYYQSRTSYSARMFKTYFKFAFVRNPEARFISSWKDKVLNNNYFDFTPSEYEKMKNIDHFISWVEKLDIDNCDEHLISQNACIDLNNIDFLGRFENFNNDLQYIAKKMNLNHNPEIKHLNKGISMKVELNPSQKKRVYEIYKKDFQIFYPAEIQ